MEFKKISKIMRHIERSTPEKVLQLRTILSNDNIEYENQADNLQEWIQNAPEKIIESLQKLYRISKEKEIKQEIIKKHTNENIEKIFSILNEEEEKEIAKIMKRKSLKMPKKVKLREETLYRNIMKINNINSINKNQKIWLTDRYLTYQYLNRIPYGNYNTIKNQINYDIQNIKRIEKDEKPKSAKSMSLKQAYDLYKKVIKFQEGIDKMSKGDFTDEDSIKTLITSVSFIFNMSKNKSQYEKNSFKAMQYAFWQTVIETGGKYAEFPISADFLQHSLEKKTENLVIVDGKVVQEIINDESFKNNIRNIVNKYGNEGDEFVFDSLKDDSFPMNFNDKDLYFAIHSADLYISGKKANDKWNLEIKLHDIYDYSVPKNLIQYYNDTSSIAKSLLSSALYNLASFSAKCGVMKEYEIDIQMYIEGFEVI